MVYNVTFAINLGILQGIVLYYRIGRNMLAQENRDLGVKQKGEDKARLEQRHLRETKNATPGKPSCGFGQKWIDGL